MIFINLVSGNSVYSGFGILNTAYGLDISQNIVLEDGCRAFNLPEPASCSCCWCA